MLLLKASRKRASIDSLWSSDAVWWHRCLMTLSHYQCWLVINMVLWHSPESNFTIFVTADREYCSLYHWILMITVLIWKMKKKYHNMPIIWEVKISSTVSYPQGKSFIDVGKFSAVATISELNENNIPVSSSLCDGSGQLAFKTAQDLIPCQVRSHSKLHKTTFNARCMNWSGTETQMEQCIGSHISARGSVPCSRSQSCIWKSLNWMPLMLGTQRKIMLDIAHVKREWLAGHSKLLEAYITQKYSQQFLKPHSTLVIKRPGINLMSMATEITLWCPDCFTYVWVVHCGGGRGLIIT